MPTVFAACYDRSYERIIQIIGSNTKDVLVYADGTLRFRHHCKVIDGTCLVVAPALRLGEGHQVVSMDPLTIEPSILCPDCGTHGFIRHGEWIAA